MMRGMYFANVVLSAKISNLLIFAMIMVMNLQFYGNAPAVNAGFAVNYVIVA